MSKKNLFLLFFFLFIVNTTILKSEEKVTFLNLEAVLNNTIVGKEIVKQLNNLNNTNSQNFKIESDKIKKKEQDLINKKNILSKEDFDLKLKDLKLEINTFNVEKKNKIINFEKLKKKELDEFIEKISPLIENYTKENSISLVINQKNVFLGNKKYDITEDIIKLVDANLK